MLSKSLGLKAALLSSALLLAACDNTTETPTTSNEESMAAASQDADMAMNNDVDLIKRAMAIHDRVITLDTHDDINVSNFTDAVNYTQDTDSQVNLPKMLAGGLDVAFFIVFTGQGELNDEGYAAAYENAMSKFDAIHWLTTVKAPDQNELA